MSTLEKLIVLVLVLVVAVIVGDFVIDFLTGVGNAAIEGLKPFGG